MHYHLLVFWVVLVVLLVSAVSWERLKSLSNKEADAKVVTAVHAARCTFLAKEHAALTVESG